MTTIVDYGMGNLGSVVNMFKRIGAPCELTHDLDKISKAKKILLPGVGAFDTAMERINSSGMLPVLNEKALKEKVPVLGICLGMQLLTHGSEEGKLHGLRWVNAHTYSFKKRIAPELKIPHMGWNVANISGQCDLTKGFTGEIRFYFVHSYFVTVDNENNSMMKTPYGVEFDSALHQDNIFGAQFHPEKSHKFGMQLFKNFAGL
jgi:imidazole glycerol-phosphate synthase subunit HisH